MQNKVNPLIVDPISVEHSASMIKKELNFPFDSKHSICRIYPDGTYFHSGSTVSSNDIYNEIAYNIIFRNESSLLVDDTIVHIGVIDEGILDSIVSRIITTAGEKFVCGHI